MPDRPSRGIYRAAGAALLVALLALAVRGPAAAGTGVGSGGLGGPLAPGAATAAAQAEAPPAEEARAEAKRILSERRFKPSSTPRPLRGVLRRLGSWIRPVAEPIGRLWSDMSGNLFGRLMLVIAVVGLALLTSIRLIRRRSAAGVSGGSKERRRRQEDPDELERRADRAEREGHLDLAYRLRFRAGLLRLDSAGLVPYRLSSTTGQLTQKVQSPTFKALATAFDEIAYGGRSAAPDDLDAARAGWPRVLQNPELAEVGGRSGARAPLRTSPPAIPDDGAEGGAPLRTSPPSPDEPGAEGGAGAPSR